MRLPLCTPIRSPATIAKRTPERMGQTTQMSRKSSARKMHLIWFNRVFPTEAAAQHHRLTAPSMHFPRICSVEAYPPQTGLSRSRKRCYALLALVCRPRIGVTKRKYVFGATHATAHRGLSPAQGRLATP
jgi:hypothetical protein